MKSVYLFFVMIVTACTLLTASHGVAAVSASRIVHVYPLTINIPARPSGIRTQLAYSIELATYRARPGRRQQPDKRLLDNHPAYVLMVTRGKSVHYAIRLGFFKTAASARVKLERLIKNYPHAKVVRTGFDEKYLSRRWYGVYASMPKAVPVAVKPRPGTLQKVALAYDTQREQSVLDQMLDVMERARQAIARQEYRRAVLLYTVVLQSPAVSLHEQALELLGLARERNGQLAHAKAEYETFLKRYPDSAAAQRIRQRLAGITTAAVKPKGKLRTTKRSNTFSSMYGSFSQYYRLNADLNDDGGSDQAFFSTDVEFNSRYRSASFELQTRMSGSYQMASESDRDDDPRLFYAYVDGSSRNGHFATRLGRQSRASGGVLGRFDGAWITVGLLPKLKANLTAGYPAYTGEDTQADQFFQSISLDFGSLAKRWDFTTFYVSQANKDIKDRKAVGGEIRYYTAKQAYFSLIDYDIMFEQTNTAMLISNWQLRPSSHMSFSIDYRRSPTLTVSNALLSQTADNLAELSQTYNEQQLHDLAKDRSPVFRSVIVFGQQKLTKHLSLNADVTATDLSATPASGGVPGSGATGLEYYYGTRLIANRVFFNRDLYMLGIRFAERATRDVWTVFLNGRMRIGRSWRINPSIRVDHQIRFNKTTVTSIEPGLQLYYPMRRSLSFELDSGYQQSDESVGVGGEDLKTFYIYAGYRWEF